ncbi:MAG: hypothetical protein QMC17_00675, partial [Paracoccaceae bacterium]
YIRLAFLQLLKISKASKIASSELSSTPSLSEKYLNKRIKVAIRKPACQPVTYEDITKDQDRTHQAKSK